MFRLCLSKLAGVDCWLTTPCRPIHTNLKTCGSVWSNTIYYLPLWSQPLQRTDVPLVYSFEEIPLSQRAWIIWFQNPWHLCTSTKKSFSQDIDLVTVLYCLKLKDIANFNKLEQKHQLIHWEVMQMHKWPINCTSIFQQKKQSKHCRWLFTKWADIWVDW